MLNLMTAIFEAHHAERNHHRRYQITVGRDLLGDWLIVIHYGRMGHRGQEERFGHADADKLRSIVRERLQRRSSAPRRIDCRYRLTELSMSPRFDA